MEREIKAVRGADPIFAPPENAVVFHLEVTKVDMSSSPPTVLEKRLVDKRCVRYATVV